MGDLQEIRNEEPWLTAEEIGQHFNRTGESIRQWARKGRIPYQTFGFGPRKFKKFQLSAVKRAYAEAS